MADSTQLPTGTLDDIARQIGDRILAELSSVTNVAPRTAVSPLAGLDPATARFKLAETFEVWKLKDGAEKELATTNEDLVTLARPVPSAYRHQVRLVEDGQERAVAFARSYDMGQGAHLVRDLFFSPSLAAGLDEALGEADRLTPASIPEGVVTRLLTLPEFQIEALWFVALLDDGQGPPYPLTTHGVIIASAPSGFPEPTMSLISSSAFVRALSQTTPGMGLLF